MPITDLLADFGVLPLRAIAFQSLLLMVAIALEALVLRQRLRLGYQTSMQYAATLNLLATSLGWLLFLTLDSLLPPDLHTQIISYVLFNRFYVNYWVDKIPVLVVMAGIIAFFATFWIKLQGLNLLLLLPKAKVSLKVARSATPWPGRDSPATSGGAILPIPWRCSRPMP